MLKNFGGFLVVVVVFGIPYCRCRCYLIRVGSGLWFYAAGKADCCAQWDTCLLQALQSVHCAGDESCIFA